MSSFSSGRSSLSGGGSASDTGGRFGSFEREDRTMGMGEAKEARNYGRRATDYCGRRTTDESNGLRGGSRRDGLRGGGGVRSGDLFGNCWS